MDESSIRFSYDTLDELVRACAKHYRSWIKKGERLKADLKRKQLAEWVRKFHEECGTLNPQVQDSLNALCKSPCLVVMTAHQPNLFAYGGVLRKATLNHVLAEKLSDVLDVPVVSFFGIADQDFADDRWVQSALLPDVERRGGVLELRLELPEKMMLNRIGKPPRTVLDSWRSEILDWCSKKLGSIERVCRNAFSDFGARRTRLRLNLDDFWKVVEDAYGRSTSYSDFNGFLISKVVNGLWGYGTLFSRFSECQRIFRDEFSYLVSEFESYSQNLKETTAMQKYPDKGVGTLECNAIPFWYHCTCGSKARLAAEREGGLLFGQGKCLRCDKEYKLSLGSEEEVDISEHLDKISARSLSMPLVIFEGLGVACYVGGIGGREYLRQARHVAGKMGLNFPPTVVWRPRDCYLGLGQLDALITFKRLSGTADLSKHSAVLAGFREKVADAQKRIADVELQKSQLRKTALEPSNEVIAQLKGLSAKQNDIRKGSDLPVIVKNYRLLKNVEAVMQMHPCMVDYSVNLGMKATSEQWIGFLSGNGDLGSDVVLKTDFDDLGEYVKFGEF